MDADSSRQLPGHPNALFGRGTAARLGVVLDEFDTQRCLVVRGGASYANCGASSYVEDALRGRHVAFVYAEHHQVTVRAVASALALKGDFGPDTVVGVGGGSVLDLAKAVSALTPQDPLAIAAVLQGRLPVRQRNRLVLIPTTAGSGSEITPFATLWNGFDKLSLDAPELLADAVLVDPNLALTVPHHVSVAAVADALCQAAESYWAVAGTPQSREWAAAAYQQLVAAIGPGCASGGFHHESLRERIAWCASLAGAAIAVSRTTAAHALSYPLTGRLGIPHGAAALLSLPWLAEHNYASTSEDCVIEGGVHHLRMLIDDLRSWCANLAGTSLAGIANRLLAFGGYPTVYRELAQGQWESDLLTMVGSPRMKNNPRRITVSDIRALLQQSRR